MQQQQHQDAASALSNKTGRKIVFLVFIWGRKVTDFGTTEL